MQKLIASTTPRAPGAMPRQSKSKPAGLTINSKPELAKPRDGDEPDPKSSPINLEGIDLSSFGGGDVRPEFANLPPLPQSPPLMPPPSPGHKRDPSKTFTSNFKKRIGPEPEQKDRGQIRQVKDDNEYRPANSSVSKIYHLRTDPGSTPELSLVDSAENVSKPSSEVSSTTTQTLSSHSQRSPRQMGDDSASVKKKEKGFRNPLSRSKSIRRDSNSKAKSNEKQSFDQPPKTAPLQSDWPGSTEMFKKTKERRGKSAERAIASESEEHLPRERAGSKDKDKGGFVTSSKHVMSKAVSGGGSLFNKLGKIGRSASNHERDVPDSEYQFKLINLPLVEQARITRISKDLGSCKDKTEYWMPSLPWRCIDYLNLNCEAEGLYRVPGSGPQVKHWQRRFDTEIDIDLLDEEALYDPNTIGSMFKSWLRDLPTDIFPKEQQQELGEELAKENPDYQKAGQPAPQKLKDTLSNLPPFNYYLLFAITCHLSLLLSHQERNRMDLNNLSICIGPCLYLERWLFNYLVGSWKQCWQGCYTEKEYLLKEKEYEQGLGEEPQPQAPISRNGSQAPTEKPTRPPMLNDRAIHSSSSNGNGGRSRSRGGSSHYEDAHSRQSPHRAPDTTRPVLDHNNQSASASALFSQLSNGSAVALPGSRRVASSDMLQRPATSGKQSAENSKVGTPTMPTHGRSQSDFQLEVQPSSPIDFPFLAALAKET